MPAETLSLAYLVKGVVKCLNSKIDEANFMETDGVGEQASEI